MATKLITPEAAAFMRRYYPKQRFEVRWHVIHRVVPGVNVSVLQQGAYRTSGPDSIPSKRYQFAHLGSWNVEPMENPDNHPHGLCWACTVAWRRARDITNDSDLQYIPFYRPETVDA